MIQLDHLPKSRKKSQCLKPPPVEDIYFFEGRILGTSNLNCSFLTGSDFEETSCQMEGIGDLGQITISQDPCMVHIYQCKSTKSKKYISCMDPMGIYFLKPELSRFFFGMPLILNTTM